MRIETLSFYFFFFGSILGFFSCGSVPSDFRKTYSSANLMLHEQKNLKETPFLKAHFKNGSVAIMSKTWKIDTLQETLSGKNGNI